MANKLMYIPNDDTQIIPSVDYNSQKTRGQNYTTQQEQTSYQEINFALFKPSQF